NASVAIFLMDDRQHCAYMNAAAEKLTGYTFEETLRRPLHDVIHHSRRDGSHFPLHECAIDRAFPENNHERGEEVFVHKDGHFYPVAFTASPIRDEASKTIGTIIEVRDITQDKRNEQIRELLMREVDHRARNTLTVVQSIIQLTKAPNIPAYREMVLGRISALGRAQGSLAAERWEGASLRSIVAEELDAISKPGQYVLQGPPVTLPPEQVQPVGMILHELATNAVKYGALSYEAGRVMIQWIVAPSSFDIEWRETGGPRTQAPSRVGFGSRLIESLGRQLQAELAYDWRPDGLTVRLSLPR
ncbi:MAG TPA: HWE histidine kinase domain-containing protein, partial [Phenylobacterium sp.]